MSDPINSELTKAMNEVAKRAAVAVAAIYKHLQEHGPSTSDNIAKANPQAASMVPTKDFTEFLKELADTDESGIGYDAEFGAPIFFLGK